MTTVEILHEGEVKTFTDIYSARKKPYDTDAYGQSLYEVRVLYSSPDSDDDSEVERLKGATIVGVYDTGIEHE